MHATTIAVGAALVSAGGGYLSSAITPFGETVDLEPDPGLRLDWRVLIIGAVGVVIAIPAFSLWWGWRTAGRFTNGSFDRAAQPVTSTPRLIPLIGRVRSGPMSSTAIRFAFGRSSERRSAGARAITCSAAVGIALFTGGLAFASSLDNVLSTPAAYGWNWDVALINSFGTIPNDALASVSDNSTVDESTAFTTDSITVEGHRVSALGIGKQSGALFLTLTSGRQPQSANEIVLGAATLRASGSSIGQQVDVVTPHGTRSMTIVGIATFPAIGSARFGSLSLGDGAAVIASVLPSGDPDGTYSGVLLRFVAGRSRPDQIAEMRRVVAELGCKDPSCFLVDAPPPQLAGYDELRSIWLAFSIAVGGLVAVPLGFGIISTTRDRRRDVTVLRALGMTHQQVATVLILYAIVIGLMSAAFGVLMGVLTANLGWHLFSRSVDIDWPIDLPAVAISLVAAGTMLVAVAIAIAVSFSRICRRTTALR
jgi:ABC-type lipoprotein release transport system permease subunit